MKKKFFHINARSGIQKVLLSLLLSGFFITSFAQNNLSDLIKGDNGVSNHFTSLAADQQIRYNASKLNSLLGLDKNSNLVLIKSEPDQLGEVHYRYYQTYLGYKVENSMFIVHTKKGIINGTTGSIITAFDPQTSSRLTKAYDAKEAIRLAINSVHAQKYMWQNVEKEQSLKKQFGKPDTSYYPHASLVWYNPGGEIKPGTLRLAYKVDVYAEKPLSRSNVYLDAQTQTVLDNVSTLYYRDTTGTANTTYSGTRTIHSNFDSIYRLQDVTRGNGIKTMHGESAAYGNLYTSNSPNWTLTGNDQAAMDVHYGVEATYDFYRVNFNRNSVNNNGFALNSYVNEYNAQAVDNAYWDGASMHYGRRSSNNASVTAIDVTGHELTHGVTQNTSGLVYSNEPGAINESMSDIMGKSVQFWAKPNDINWQLSNDMNWIIRDMSNPNALSDPDTYKGTFWYTGSNQNILVHTNSGVGNYMFYLLVSGGSGTNDSGHVFSVTGIGLAKADQIIYRSETVYLTPTSNYADWRKACIKAAGDLYGSCSNEAFQTANAWYAVGVGAAPPKLNLNICGTVAAGNYAASSTITSCSGGTATVSSAAATTFTANEITFLPGFNAVAGCNFQAYITPCTSSISLLPNNNSVQPDYTDPVAASVHSAPYQKTKDGEFVALVYPNPAASNAILQLKNAKGRVSVTLINAQGKILWKNESSAEFNIHLPIANLAGGVYLLIVKDNIHCQTLKVIKK